MSQKLLIDGSRESQTQVALLSEGGLEDFEFESSSKRNLKGNIYLGKVSRIEASLQAAFIDIGAEKNGFLAFGEIHPNYFQIPVADREALIEAEVGAEEEYNNENGINQNVTEQQNDLDQNSTSKTEGELEVSEIKEKVSSNKENKFSSNLKRKLYRSYKIQEVIKTGQLILIQVVKEERGNKGAALTSYISLAGKYTVLMPNSTKTKGISRKISTSDDRNKLKQIIDDLNVPSEMGLIIRTAGLNKTKNEIKRDYATLNKLWVDIVTETKRAIAPALIHEEGNLLRRVLRDVYTKEMKDVLVEGKDAYQETKKYMSQVLPSCSKFVKQYKNKEPIFTKYKVENEIIKMFDPEVKLKSGGYLVINPTEALVAIDVNSGGATKERNIEKTALKTNLEAAVEIAKQIKIRDLSGLIVIDFIDMYEMRNNRQVEKKVKELIRKDRARTQVSRISQFGLLEMSRQRLRQSFIEWKTELSQHSSALKSIYFIKEKLNNKKHKTLTVNINPFMKKYLVDNFQSEISNIANENKCEISFVEDITIDNSEINIGDSNNDPKKTEKKPKKKIVKKRASTVKKKSSAVKKTKIKDKIPVKQIISPIKEIKDKKSGWWQK
ncbi:MAG: Rne/Rng family ribonuclease [Candidatus Pelagibacter sp. TMED263]|nr:MAG: Rne/Rng family ribonuclease [Candidatus Pelagibacter sp. TMED263]